MSDVAAPTKDNPIVAAEGAFFVYNAENAKVPVKLTFMSLMIELGLFTLQNSRNAFQTQFERAQEKVNCMQALNDLVKTINSLKANFPDNKDLKSDDMVFSDKLYDQIRDYNRKYPNSTLSFGDNVFSKWSATAGDAVGGKKIGHNSDMPLVITKSEYNKIKDGDWSSCSSTGKTLVSKSGLESLSSNAQTAQSTLSSENEQQNMRTNQAMNRSSGFLQQLQAMMQTAKEAQQAATKTGGV